MIVAVNWVTITSITVAIIIFHIIFKVSLFLNFVVLGPVPSGLLELSHLYSNNCMSKHYYFETEGN